MNTTPLEKWIIDDAKLKKDYRKTLNAYQLSNIKNTIKYAKENSLFYKNLFENVSENISSLKDFSEIPFIYSKDIAENPYNFLCMPQKFVNRIVTLNTSGTTGNNKRIFFTENELNMTVDFFAAGFKAMVSKNDRVMIMMPGLTYGSVGDIIKKSLDKLNVVNFVSGVMKDSYETASFIKDNNINSIVALPMQILYLSRVHKDPFNSIEKLMLSADYVPEFLIKELGEKNCSVFTHYGMTETAYGCAVECEALSGYHYRENQLYLEIVNPLTGEVLKDGNWGEIVVTTFNREAMPLIRYRTGDWGAFKTEKCKCSTFLKTLERSRGRINNIVNVCGTNIEIREFDELLLKFEPVLDYKISQENANLKITLYLNGDYNLNNIEKTLDNFLQNKLNNKCKFTLVPDKKENIAFVHNTMIKRAPTKKEH
ncbi:MAG: DVU_1553 family AMP-dependent CoA ligase [Bacteroidales bacterium]|jgi:phenylacetate-coenzyme A ligase PaaK-like adenylate-forming protein